MGWFPSGISALIVGLLVMYLWGLLAVVGLLWLLIYFSRGSQHSRPDKNSLAAASDAASAAADASAAANTAAADANAAAAAAATPTAAPPPPNLKQAEAAVRQYQRLYSSSGIAGVITLTMECYSRLTRTSSWSDWDFCAALDQLGSNFSAQSQRNGGVPTDYFEQSSTARRQVQAASILAYGPELNQDRVAAMKTMVDQAIADVAAQPVPPVNINGADSPASADRPSFDCDRVQKQNLKLVCNTPALAQADRQLADAYRDALSSSRAPSDVRDSQRGGCPDLC
ncbi:MAG: lysozyme inhibitor LprI family protein [Caulobacteraceae bacterium]